MATITAVNTPVKELKRVICDAVKGMMLISICRVADGLFVALRNSASANTEKKVGTPQRAEELVKILYLRAVALRALEPISASRIGLDSMLKPPPPPSPGCPFPAVALGVPCGSSSPRTLLMPLHAKLETTASPVGPANAATESKMNAKSIWLVEAFGFKQIAPYLLSACERRDVSRWLANSSKLDTSPAETDGVAPLVPLKKEAAPLGTPAKALLTGTRLGWLKSDRAIGTSIGLSSRKGLAVSRLMNTSRMTQGTRYWQHHALRSRLALCHLLATRALKCRQKLTSFPPSSFALHASADTRGTVSPLASSALLSSAASFSSLSPPPCLASSATFKNTSSMVVTDKPKPSQPRVADCCSSVCSIAGKLAVEERGSLYASSVPTLLYCSAPSTWSVMRLPSAMRSDFSLQFITML
mmetsp:Transcript_17546/g.34249  ORF Transcript_17546/g.34249 Transcript_17546/m.34249 type:complete len:415 (+) Transcript_17546:2343-3587(+)